jgi:tubulin-specific chaperone D
VRKLEAAIKLYGGLLEVSPDRAKVLEKLTGILLHPFPRVRNLVAEELWVRCGVGKGVNWVKAGKEDLVRLRGVLEENLRAGVVVYGDGG